MGHSSLLGYSSEQKSSGWSIYLRQACPVLQPPLDRLYKNKSLYPSFSYYLQDFPSPKKYLNLFVLVWTISWFQIVCSTLTQLLTTNTGLTNALLPMVPEGKHFPTWTQTYKPENLILDYRSLQIVANAYYNWVITQNNHATRTKSCLVASLWDPISQTIYSSTIPRKEGRDTIAEFAKDLAPVWLSKMGGSWELHAEDGAYFMFEAQNPQRGATQYPPGMMIATYGVRSGGPIGPVSLCDQTARIPSCEDVSAALGVATTDVSLALGLPPEVPPVGIDNDNDDFPISILDLAVLQACAGENIGQTGEPSGQGSKIRRALIRGDTVARRQAAPAPSSSLTLSQSVSCTALPWQSPTTTTGPLPSEDLTTLSPAASPTMTPPPVLTCTLQNEDPDQGINNRGCICGSTTLPLLTVTGATDPAQSCSYTALPTQAVPNPITIETQTWTSNCQACTLVGGVADTPTCTSVTGCTPTQPVAPPMNTYALWLSNNTLPTGDIDNTNDGSDLRNELANGLKGSCPNNTLGCDSTSPYIISNVPTIIDGRPAYIDLEFTVQDSSYTSTSERDSMIASIVSTWERATNKNCSEVDFTDEPDPTTVCSQSPVRRNLPPWEEAMERSAVVCDHDLCPPTVSSCSYKARICRAPDHISKLLNLSYCFAPLFDCYIKRTV